MPEPLIAPRQNPNMARAVEELYDQASQLPAEDRAELAGRLLEARLGALAPFQVHFPVPIPALGGSGDLATYDRGGMWEYLSFVVQTLGISVDRRA